MGVFSEDLKFSLAPSTRLKINEFYLNKFPMVIDIEEVEELELQKKGVDIKLCFEDGSFLYIEEKLRRQDYGDIFLEIIANSSKKSLGWSLTCQADYIAYIVEPTARVYLLPVQILKMALLNNYNNWIFEYGTKKSNNLTYYSLGVCVGIDVLYEAIEREFKCFLF